MILDNSLDAIIQRIPLKVARRPRREIDAGKKAPIGSSAGA
jgi:hypothetical protein